MLTCKDLLSCGGVVSGVWCSKVKSMHLQASFALLNGSESALRGMKSCSFKLVVLAQISASPIISWASISRWQFTLVVSYLDLAKLCNEWHWHVHGDQTSFRPLCCKTRPGVSTWSC